MAANTTVSHVAMPTKGPPRFGVDSLAFGEELIDLVAESFVDFFVLGWDAAVKHGTATGLVFDLFAAVSAPYCLVHRASINRDFSPVPHSIMRGEPPLLCLGWRVRSVLVKYAHILLC